MYIYVYVYIYMYMHIICVYIYVYVHIQTRARTDTSTHPTTHPQNPQQTTHIPVDVVEDVEDMVVIKGKEEGVPGARVPRHHHGPRHAPKQRRQRVVGVEVPSKPTDAVAETAHKLAPFAPW